MRNNKYIYLPLMGRIGNQLFEYAFAYSIQQQYGQDTLLVIDESDVIASDWVNSLRDYKLPNVVYVSDHNNEYWKDLGQSRFAQKIYDKLLYNDDPQLLYSREKKYQPFLNQLGLIAVIKGYADYNLNSSKSVLLYGYFQSERYFETVRDKIKHVLDRTEDLKRSNYPNLELIEKRESVCISIKIEHNLGSGIYDVCDEEYYKRAIEYIEERVDNPVYFICSDNVELAREKFFSGFDADTVCQASDFPVSLSLCAMSRCKHFVINNTSFGWWAQYLSDNESKIVIAPDRWMNNTDPVSIYDNQNNWHLINCSRLS